LRWNNAFNFIGVGDGIWSPLSAPFLKNGADNGLTYEEVLNGHSMIRNSYPMTKEKANIGEDKLVNLNGETKLGYLESIKEGLYSLVLKTMVALQVVLITIRNK